MKLSVTSVSGWLPRVRGAAVELLFPARCLGCAADLTAEAVAPGRDGVMLCGDCRDQLPLVEWPVCARCAAPVPAAGGVVLECNHCREVKLRFDRTIALGSYDGLLRQLIMRMKTDRSELLVHLLTELAWRERRAELQSLDVDVVTAVPMHPWRRWRRGTNPPRAMAQRLAEKLRAPAAGGMLRLLRNVPAQVGLSRPARFRNVQGEMAVRATYHLEAAHVLLVDDILTTGATCSEAARVLKRAGAKEVTVFVVGRTPLD